MIRSVYLSDERSEGPLCDSDQIEKKSWNRSVWNSFPASKTGIAARVLSENQSGKTSKYRAIEIRARRLQQECTAEYCGVSGRLRSEQVHLIGFRSPLPRIRLEETAMRQDCFFPFTLTFPTYRGAFLFQRSRFDACSISSVFGQTPVLRFSLNGPGFLLYWFSSSSARDKSAPRIFLPFNFGPFPSDVGANNFEQL